MKTAESFPLYTCAFRKYTKCVAFFQFQNRPADRHTVYGASFYGKCTELAENVPKNRILKELFFGHIMDDAVFKRHANDRRIKIAFMIRRHDNCAFLGNIFPSLHVETVNAEKESVEKHSHHAVKYLFKHLPALLPISFHRFP